jgi:predicted CXXCH cytochrome family protein
MFRPYSAGDVIGDFSGKQVAAGARPFIKDGRHFFDIRRGDTAQWAQYPVDYVIGSKWQQAYATRLPDSRILVFPIQYSRNRSAWLNYWAAVDGPGSRRTDISRFHEIPEGAIYQTACAPCHTSQLKFPHGIGHAASATFREPGINCEMCHGPSLAHIERIRTGGVAARATHDTPVRFSRLPAPQYVAVCSQCHAQSAVHNAEAGGNVNYSEHVPFYRAYPAHLPSNFSRKAFFRDGRFRATTFISESFVRSQCFRKGEATCGSCHDPHPADAATNPTSLKFRDDPDRLCVQCHAAIGERPERHTRHAAGTEASRCVSCHMPKIMDALLFPARSHEIDDVPDVEMTARFGNEDSPNACLLCHQDRDVTWLREKMAELF